MEKQNIFKRAYQEVKSAMPGKKAIAIMCGLGIAGGGLVYLGELNGREQIRNAEFGPNTLELTCEQLSQRGFEAKGVDGNTYKISCEDYETPALQERGN